MKIEATAIPEVKLLHPQRLGDERGWFSETWSAAELARAGLGYRFAQDNLSYSRRAGTLRGLHCQLPPVAQRKLVGVLTGAILDVAVDIREGSPDYGGWAKVRLDADTPAQLLAPAGFLHGFVTLKPDTRVAYKVTAPYSRPHDRSVAWNDPALGVDWEIKDPILSDRDAKAPTLADSDVRFCWNNQV